MTLLQYSKFWVTMTCWNFGDTASFIASTTVFLNALYGSCYNFTIVASISTWQKVRKNRSKLEFVEFHEVYDAYSIRSTWSCYWLDQFLTLAFNTLILSIFYISLDLSTIYFTHFSGCWASFVCTCHSILECCVMFSGVKLSIRSFNLFLVI